MHGAFMVLLMSDIDFTFLICCALFQFNNIVNGRTHSVNFVNDSRSPGFRPKFATHSSALNF